MYRQATPSTSAGPAPSVTGWTPPGGSPPRYWANPASYSASPFESPYAPAVDGFEPADGRRQKEWSPLAYDAPYEGSPPPPRSGPTMPHAFVDQRQYSSHPSDLAQLPTDVRTRDFELQLAEEHRHGRQVESDLLRHREAERLRLGSRSSLGSFQSGSGSSARSSYSHYSHAPSRTQEFFDGQLAGSTYSSAGPSSYQGFPQLSPGALYPPSGQLSAFTRQSGPHPLDASRVPLPASPHEVLSRTGLPPAHHVPGRQHAVAPLGHYSFFPDASGPTSRRSSRSAQDPPDVYTQASYDPLYAFPVQYEPQPPHPPHNNYPSVLPTDHTHQATHPVLVPDHEISRAFRGPLEKTFTIPSAPLAHNTADTRPRTSHTVSSTSSSSTMPRTVSNKKKRNLQADQPIAWCSDCAVPIAHLFLRGEEKHFELEWEGVWVCKPCMDVRKANGIEVAEEKEGRRKKRNRAAQDLKGRVECDVCLRFVGQGGIVPKNSKSTVEFTTEFVCVSCRDRYARCSDCGGGGGGRIGIGKWRCKELFPGNRKTCSLSHTRVGSAPLLHAVWKVQDFIDRPHVREELYRLCESRWRDRTIARLAIPEVLESKDPRARSFADIEAALSGGWPSREALFEGIETPWVDDRRRFFGLTWCKTRPRRSLPDGKENHLKSFETGKDGRPVEKVKDIIPAGHELVGLFLGHWSMNDGTLLITTSLPFDINSDGGDRMALAVGEMACRIVAEIDSINAHRLAHHQTCPPSTPLHVLPPLEHLWVICDNPDSLRDRMRDQLTRRRDFLPLEEYVAAHPDVNPRMFDVNTCYMPLSGPSWITGMRDDGLCEVLVHHLGSHFDRSQLDDIANTEQTKRLGRSRKPASASQKSGQS